MHRFVWYSLSKNVIIRINFILKEVRVVFVNASCQQATTMCVTTISAIVSHIYTYHDLLHRKLRTKMQPQKQAQEN
jgi:hypothetical protein